LIPWNAEESATKHPALGPFHDLREMVLAAVMALLAGAIGAAAWVYSSGWFVTFMTGNSERLVLENIRGLHGVATAAALSIAAFVLGTVVATVARLYLWKKARHGATVLTMTAAVAAATFDITMVDESQELGAVPVLLLAFGLGALNTSISRRGEVVMPLSYMTGTLVKIGQGMTLHCAGVSKWSWVPHLTTYTGFMAGAAVGGVSFGSIGAHQALFTVAIGATLIAALTWRLDHRGFTAQDAR